MDSAPRRLTLATATVVALALHVGLLVGLLVGLPQSGGGDAPEPVAAAEPAVTPAAPAPSKAPARTGTCGRPTKAFAPRTISLQGVVRDAEVMAVPRDSAGVPGVPPVAAKDVFAWDRGGVRAGSRRGHVLLNTHTWPDGSAMGNTLLAKLQKGAPLLLRSGKQVACYRVTKRVEVREEDGYPGWSATDGPPRVVIVVCSGKRLGPGRWTHRTLWFATPVR